MALIVQLTDLHLLCDPSARLKNVPTWETFREVLEHVRSNAGDWDLLVITGDLAHDELAETYDMLREALGKEVFRCRLVPGNHDNRAGIRKVFPEIVSSVGEFLSFLDSIEQWRVVGLDTHVPGEVSGRLDRDQLDWFSHQLQQKPRRPVLVFLHHPPISVSSPWLDKIGLEDPEPFSEIVESHPEIRAIAAGHVHHVFEGKLGSADVLTTPSTAIQFVPGGEQAAYSDDPPGYRIFDLDEDGFSTRVHRLPVLRFPPSEE